jgi:hypothetical protein
LAESRVQPAPDHDQDDPANKQSQPQVLAHVYGTRFVTEQSEPTAGNRSLRAGRLGRSPGPTRR